VRRRFISIEVPRVGSSTRSWVCDFDSGCDGLAEGDAVCEGEGRDRNSLEGVRWWLGVVERRRQWLRKMGCLTGRVLLTNHHKCEVSQSLRRIPQLL